MTTKAQREAAALRRLKQRIRRYRIKIDTFIGRVSHVRQRDVFACIDAWHAAERKRGGR